jgi:predicted ester cyclase
MKPMPKLCALVAYYPTQLPTATTAFPPSLLVQIHIASSQNFTTRHPSFTYPETTPGFAEHDSEQYDKIGSRLAWSKTLGLMRKGFGIDVDLEAIWENHTALEFVTKDAEATMQTMVAEPYVNHVPTMTGGIGHRDLKRFYAEFFIPSNPPDMKMKLLSRTVGTDRVVDELHTSFTHTKEVPWMLPGVPATGKRVDVIIVAVVCIRGGKLYHEHIHWDQASVLMQIGLLDPQLVPNTFTSIEQGAEKEIDELPVVGLEGALKVVDEEDGENNLFLRGW